MFPGLMCKTKNKNENVGSIDKHIFQVKLITFLMEVFYIQLPLCPLLLKIHSMACNFPLSIGATAPVHASISLFTR